MEERVRILLDTRTPECGVRSDRLFTASQYSDKEEFHSDLRVAPNVNMSERALKGNGSTPKLSNASTQFAQTLPRLILCGGPFFIWTDLVPHPNLTGASSGPASSQAVRCRAVSSDRRLNPPSVLDSPDWDEPPPACVFLIWAGWAEWSQ